MNHSVVSEMSNMSTLLSAMKERESNLFLIELMVLGELPHRKFLLVKLLRGRFPLVKLPSGEFSHGNLPRGKLPRIY